MKASLLDGKTVLITGASGFIGSRLLECLANVNIVALVREKGCGTQSDVNITYEYGDISQDSLWKRLFSQYDLDYIFHLAAIEYQGLSGDVIRDLEVNSMSALHLLNNVKTLTKRPKIVFFSSVNVFGSISADLVTEDSCPRPESYWSHHKVLNQYYFELYSRAYGVESIILMLPNIYGFSKNIKVTMRMSLNKMIQDALVDNQVTLYQNSSIKRNFLHIDDLLSAIFLVLKIKTWDANLYLVGDENHYSFDDLFRILCEAKPDIGRKNNFTQLDAFEMRDYKIDTRRFRKETGWKVNSTFQENILSTYREISENLSLNF